MRDGMLYSRASGDNVRDLLDGHAGLEEEADVEFFAQVLTRIANEVYRPLPSQMP